MCNRMLQYNIMKSTFRKLAYNRFVRLHGASEFLNTVGKEKLHEKEF
jgi:hypothetical protein